jgi:hypothetical protein
MKRSLGLVFLALVAVAGWCSVPQETKRGQVAHEALDDTRIYAYRDWQSTGLRVHQDDAVLIEAQGTWLYTPDEYHGPEGHRRYLAPDFYPLPGVPGGALIGRIGEDAAPFYVGKRAHLRAQHDGFLYLRIDDDILSDNEGYVEVEIQVVPSEE